MKRVAGTDEHPLIARIPDVVRIAIVGIEPKLRIITLHVEHVQIAVRVQNV